MKYSKEDQQRARERLHELLTPGDTVYTVLRHTARSGMMRAIDLYVMAPYTDRNGTHTEPVNISYYAAALCGWTRSETYGGAINASGAGMDMGFHLVYELSYRLWPDGFECIGEQCHSNDHTNGDRDYTPHHHTSGGYALRHRWM